MDGVRFDALTRRFLIAGAAGGVIAPLLGSNAAAAKQCKKGRKPCGKRCCPRGQRCANDVCIRTCANPGTCELNSKIPACGGYIPDVCGCIQTLGGGSACVQTKFQFNYCETLAPCDAATPCPAGQLCVAGCCGSPQQFRCFDPCAGPFI